MDSELFNFPDTDRKIRDMICGILLEVGFEEQEYLIPKNKWNKFKSKIFQKFSKIFLKYNIYHNSFVRTVKEDRPLYNLSFIYRSKLDNKILIEISLFDRIVIGFKNWKVHTEKFIITDHNKNMDIPKTLDKDVLRLSVYKFLRSIDNSDEVLSNVRSNILSKILIDDKK